MTRTAADWRSVCACMTSAETASWTWKSSADLPRLLAPLFLDSGHIAEPEPVQLPDELRTESSRKLQLFILLSAPSPKAMNCMVMLPGFWKPVIMTCAAGAGHFLSPDADQRRLDHCELRADLGAILQGDRDQLVERPGRIDEGYLKVIVLDRHDDARVEPKHQREVRTGDAQCSRAEAASCSRSANSFLARPTSTRGIRSLLSNVVRSRACGHGRRRRGRRRKSPGTGVP